MLQAMGLLLGSHSYYHYMRFIGDVMTELNQIWLVILLGAVQSIITLIIAITNRRKIDALLDLIVLNRHSIGANTEATDCIIKTLENLDS